MDGIERAIRAVVVTVVVLIFAVVAMVIWDGHENRVHTHRNQAKATRDAQAAAEGFARLLGADSLASVPGTAQIQVLAAPFHLEAVQVSGDAQAATVSFEVDRSYLEPMLFTGGVGQVSLCYRAEAVRGRPARLTPLPCRYSLPLPPAATTSPGAPSPTPSPTP